MHTVQFVCVCVCVYRGVVGCVFINFVAMFIVSLVFKMLTVHCKYSYKTHFQVNMHLGSKYSDTAWI